MKVFVTGATGFIGRRLIKRLISQNWEVTALVRNKEHGLPPSVNVVLGDILDAESLKESGANYDRLYHLAAVINFQSSKRDELKKVNEEGTRIILEAAKKWNIRRTIVVSSACTMGITEDEKTVLDENSPLKSELAEKNPYMESKCGSERIVRDYLKYIPIVVVNPATVYGPGDKTLNSGIIVKIINKMKIIPVFPGGGNVVDVDDVVDGIILAGEKGVSGRRYILGGNNLKFKEIFSTIAEVLGKKPVWVPLSRWLKYPMAICAFFAGIILGNRFITPQIIEDLFSFKYYSSELAFNDLGWKAHYSFKETVSRAIEYYRQEKLL